MGMAGKGGSLLYKKHTISKLSELEIDVDKNWLTFGITRLKELAGSMERGDVLFHNGSKLEKVTPGSVGTMLTTHGLGNAVTWEYGPHPE